MAAVGIADADLGHFEAAITRIPGIREAKVVGEHEPEEIHVVADRIRPAKQIVRDIQSLGRASFDIPIDHRIVSVVQVLDADREPGPDTPPQVIPSTAGLEDVRRPVVIEQIVVASKPGSSRVNVALRWLDGTRTEGSGVAGFSREARARGAASAVLEALRPFLEARSVQVEVDQVQLHRMADVDVALVRVFLLEAGRTIQLMGTARLDDDVASAAARALLDAVNRKLSLL